jgi:transcription antitermination protein NusB
MRLSDRTKRRARALQLLYALELLGERDVHAASSGLARLTGPEPMVHDEAIALVDGVLAHRDAIDRLASAAAEHWRFDRIASVERNLLRLSIHELMVGVVPPKVVIDEAIWLAHRFAGAKAPGFINGVLDRVARDLGRL